MATMKAQAQYTISAIYDGAKGDTGVSITSVNVWYAKNTSSTDIPTSGWSTTSPTWQEGSYIWSKTITTYSSGNPTESKAVCITGFKGQTGTGVTSITEEYYLSDNKDTQNGGSWGTTPPSWSYGTYIWTRSKIVYSNPASTVYTTPVCDSSWEAVNEIEIGGKNLILGSNNVSYWTGVSNYELKTGLNKLNVFTLTRADTTSSSRAFLFNRNCQLLDSEQYYTFSGYYKVNSSVALDGSMNFFIRVSNNNTFVDICSLFATSVEYDKWIYFSITGKHSLSDTIAHSAYLALSKNGSVSICGLKIEKGNKATDWTPAPEDVQEQIDTTLSQLSDIASDAKFTPNEKVQTNKEWGEIKEEKIKLIAQATTYSVVTTDYVNAYTALSTYIEPLLASLTTTSNIVQTDFVSKFKTYYNTRTDLTDAISTAKAKLEASNIQIGGRNLIVLTTCSDGYLTSAGLQANDMSWTTTDFIAVKPGDQLIASGYTNLGASPSTCFYNSSKTFVSGIKNNNSVTTATEETMKNDLRRLVTVPVGCYYTKFSYQKSDKGKIKLEKGNKATDYTPSPEDVQAQIDTTVSLLSDMASDSKLTPNEKLDTKKEWDGINGEYSKYITQANGYSVSTTAYTNTYNDLNAYLNTTNTGVIFNLTTTTDIIRSVFVSKFTDYYNNRTDLVNAIATAKAKYEANAIQIGGRNYIKGGKGEDRTGFFKNFSKVENGYGEHSLTSQKTYANVSIAQGFVLGCRDYKVGSLVTISYEIMYTNWNFPEGTNRAEFWMGQRYSGASSTSSIGTWRGVTQHSLPIVGTNECVLNEWYHVERTLIIPEQAGEGILETASVQFYNSNADVAASITFRIKNVKIEYGNKATDWTPSNEEIEDIKNNAISNVDVVYALGDTTTTAPTTGWSTTAPTWISGKYMWQKTITTYGNNTSVESNPTCISGATGQGGAAGKGIKSIVEYYYKSTSATSLSGSTWGTASVTWENGKYIWTKSLITYTDNSTTETLPICASGQTGANGTDAKTLSLTSSRYAVAFTSSNTAKDTTNITLTAIQQNYSDAITWTTTPTVTLSGSGNSRTLPVSAFSSNNEVKVTISSGGLTDVVNIVKVTDGAQGVQGSTGSTGASGADAYTVILTNEVQGIPTNTSRVPSSTITYTTDVIAYKGATSVTPTIGTIASANGITVSVSGTRVSFAVSTGTTITADSGTFTIPITVDGKSFTKTFSWACSKQGVQGATGSTGATGNGVSSITEYYLISANATGVTTSTSGWDTKVPTMTETNKYLWNYEVINFTSGSQETTPKIIGVYGTKGNTGSTGATGNGISSIVNYYLATSSASGVTTTTTGWTTAIQNVTSSKKYLWNYEIINYTSGSYETSTPCIIGTYGDKGDKGDTGSQGVQGAKGETGATLYTWIKYADSPTSGMSDIPTGKKYIGIAYNKTTATESTTYADYSWALTKGDTGSTGATGATGEQGVSITKVEEWFYLSTDKTTPTGGSWKLEAPTWSAGKYMWRYTKVYYSKGDPTSSVQWCDNSWEAVNEIQIGGKNILLKSNIEASTSEYLISSYNPTELFESGQYYTVTVCVTPASGTKNIPGYVSGGYKNIFSIPVSGTTKQVVTKTFLFDAYYTGRVPDTIEHSYAKVSFYRTPNDGTVTASSTIHYVKIEKGNKATDYTVAPEDINTTIDDIKSNAISSVVIEYYLSTSVTAQAGGSWDTVVPVWRAGYYYWRRENTTRANGTSTTSTPVLDKALNGAYEKSAAAMVSADSKNTVFYLDGKNDASGVPTVVPTGYNGQALKINDLWFNTGEGNCSYRWNGTQWEKKQYGTAAIDNLDVGKLTGDVVAANLIGANSIKTIHLATDAITSANYELNVSGSALSLKDGTFDSKNLKWDASGNLTANNATITGSLTAGKVGGWDITSEYIKSGNTTLKTTGEILSQGGNADTYSTLFGGNIECRGLDGESGNSTLKRAWIHSGAIDCLRVNPSSGTYNRTVMTSDGIFSYDGANKSVFHLNNLTNSLVIDMPVDIRNTVSISGTTSISGATSITGAITSDLAFATESGGYYSRGIKWTMGTNDWATIRTGSYASNSGFLEIATYDDMNEPIIFKQCKGAEGSVTASRTLTLLTSTGDSEFPGNIKVNSGNGIMIYGTTNYLLREHGNGNVTVNGWGGYLRLGHENTSYIDLYAPINTTTILTNNYLRSYDYGGVARNMVGIDGSGNMQLANNGCTYALYIGNATNNGTYIRGRNVELVVADDGSPRLACMAVYQRTYSSGATVTVTSAGTIGRISSASKYKLDITESNRIGDNILSLKPKMWFDKTNSEMYADALTKLDSGEITEEEFNKADIQKVERQYGLIAEELEAVGLSHYCIYNAHTGEIEGIQYDRMWVDLIPIIKSLTDRVSELERKVTT